jgi:hypothetical protein
VAVDDGSVTSVTVTMTASQRAAIDELLARGRAALEDLPGRAEVLPYEQIKGATVVKIMHAEAPDGTPECDAVSKDVTQDPTDVNCGDCLDLIEPWIQGTAEI